MGYMRHSHHTSRSCEFRPEIAIERNLDSGSEPVHPTNLTRRRLLTVSAGLSSAALAGCVGGQQSDADVDPITLASGDQCDVCGMVIADHPGPNGQIFYADRTPTGHANPALFDSLRGCLFPYYFEHDRLDWDDVGLFVTDYSTVEYSVFQAGDRTFISPHTDAESFTDGLEATYVVGSDVRGAMGPDFISFSSRDDADAFANDYGGEVLGFDEIAPDVLSS